MAGKLTWRDGERLILAHPGLVDQLPAQLAANGWERFALLTTPRALSLAPGELAEHAAEIHEVPAGPVPEAAAAIIDAVEARSLVALGGGRVIDAAKAIAAVKGGRVAAVPTTLSGAEMTGIHRFPAGHQAARLVRPSLVLADPEPMTGLPEARLRASAVNALAHGADSLYTPLANPVARLAAIHGAGLIAAALGQPRRQRDRAGLALGSLLCAYSLDSAGLALHHALAQTTVQVVGSPHAETHAALLPRTMAAMLPRAREAIEALAEALGTDAEGLPGAISELAGGQRLGGLGIEPAALDTVAEAAGAHPALANTPDPPEPAELRRILEAAL